MFFSSFFFSFSGRWDAFHLTVRIFHIERVSIRNRRFNIEAPIVIENIPVNKNGMDLDS